MTRDLRMPPTPVSSLLRGGAAALLAVLVAALATAPLAAQHAYQAAGATFDPRVTTPRASLGYEVGEQFTPHHRIVRYLEQLAATSPRVRVDTLGHTAEGREVVMAPRPGRPSPAPACMTRPTSGRSRVPVPGSSLPSRSDLSD
jgi:hypothetical protein